VRQLGIKVLDNSLIVYLLTPSQLELNSANLWFDPGVMAGNHVEGNGRCLI
jgi:hypothetical protein